MFDHIVWISGLTTESDSARKLLRPPTRVSFASLPVELSNLATRRPGSGGHVHMDRPAGRLTQPPLLVCLRPMNARIRLMIVVMSPINVFGLLDPSLFVHPKKKSFRLPLHVSARASSGR